MKKLFNQRFFNLLILIVFIGIAMNAAQAWPLPLIPALAHFSNERSHEATTAKTVAVVRPAGSDKVADSWGDALAPKAGKDYQILTTAANVPASKIEVIEFFWYGCPHCAVFEPVLAAWLKKQGPEIIFKRVPVAFSDDFIVHQRLYHTVAALGIVGIGDTVDTTNTLTSKIFEEIQQRKNYLLTDHAQADFIAKYGVDKKRFLDAYHSSKVTHDIKQDNQLIAAYHIDGVPTVVVQGKYKTSPAMTQSLDRTTEVLDFLVKQIQAGKM